MQASIESKVKEIIVEHLEIDEEKVIPEASFADDLDLDSLDAMDVLMAINEEFKIHIPPEKMDQIQTVQDMIAAVQLSLIRTLIVAKLHLSNDHLKFL